MERNYYLLQWTWGLLQNLSGGLHYLLNLSRPHMHYRKAIVTVWKKRASASVGMFIFLGVSDRDILRKKKPFTPDSLTPSEHRVLVHEYGHTLQSLLFGPFFLPLVALPSTLWAGLGKRLRRKKHLFYYSVFPEKNANRLAQRVTGEETPH